MLAIGIFAPYGTDHDRNIAFCHDTDVHHIVLSAAGIGDEGSIPSTDALKDLVEQIRRCGYHPRRTHTGTDSSGCLLRP